MKRINQGVVNCLIPTPSTITDPLNTRGRNNCNITISNQNRRHT